MLAHVLDWILLAKDAVDGLRFSWEIKHSCHLICRSKASNHHQPRSGVEDLRILPAVEIDSSITIVIFKLNGIQLLTIDSVLMHPLLPCFQSQNHQVGSAFQPMQWERWLWTHILPLVSERIGVWVPNFDQLPPSKWVIGRKEDHPEERVT